MAFGKGQESVESGNIKKYIGIASCKVLAVNPSKAELEKIYNRTLENAPEYLGETEINGEKVSYARIDFIVQADPEKYGIDFINKVSIFVRKSYRFNKDKTKVQVIDKYGRTVWVTVEQAKAHEIPVYSNGPANIDKDYRPAYVGEEELIKFLIAYVNIPSCQKYIDGKWVMNDAQSLPDSEASLEHIADYFNGKFDELKSIVNLQPNNKVKILFGIRNADDGRQYQTSFTRMFLKNSVSDYNKIAKEVKQAQEAGSLSTSEFECSEIHEYSIESTNFSSTLEDDPFAAPDVNTNTPWGTV